MTPKILAFAGSLRKGSYNNMTVKIAEQGAIEAGAEVTHINLREIPLPLFDEDLEAEGMPDNVIVWKELFKSHHGILISCPEYNSSITGVFKNLIDWISRPVPGEFDFEPFVGKVCSVMSASPGAFGGLRGLPMNRALLSHVQMIVLPEHVAVTKAGDAFNEDGTFKDPKMTERIQKLGRNTVEVIRKLHS